MLGIAWLLSVDRKGIRFRPVVWGVVLQAVLALLVLHPAIQGFFFETVDRGVNQLLSFAHAGAEFVFSTIEPHRIVTMSGDTVDVIGRVSPPLKTFAFWVLPTIVFFSSLMAVLYHFGVMQRLVHAVAWLMQRTMGTSGPESLSTAANVFVGQSEAPLAVRPYIDKMSRSELHAVMTGGFATVSGGIMGAYVSFLRDVPNIAGHLVTASILSAPAALAVSKVMVPEDGSRPVDAAPISDRAPAPPSHAYQNSVHAAAVGALDGARLAFDVAAVLVAFVGLVTMADFLLGLVPLGGEPLSLSRVLGWLFSPIAVLLGIPWGEATVAGRLLGEKLVLTELLAYAHLGDLMARDTPPLSDRSAIILSYALCGFANFASVGIQLGALGGMAPKRMPDLAALGLRAMVAGSLAAFMTAAVAGVIL